MDHIKKRAKSLRMYCFSPPVMLATFIIEVIFAIYVVMRYKLNAVGRLVVIILVCLAIFQLAEYAVCQVTALDPLLAARIGYVAITLLPPLGIHLAYALGKNAQRPLLWPAYATAAAFAGFFLFAGPALTAHVCAGNYVIFETAPGSQWLYALYYYGWLFVGVGLCLRRAEQVVKKAKMALYGLAAGYAAFIVPTTAVNVIDPSTIQGIPSIMCGFAVLLAFVLVGWVMPRAGVRR